MAKIEDFFIPENHVDEISEEDYKRAEPVISAIKAVARVTYHSIYIIDYYQKNFLYVSDNPLFLCGLKSSEVKEMGYAFYFNYMTKNDLDMLLEINRAGFEFFNKTPAEDRTKLSISYDFHILNGKKKTLINHKLTPVLLAENGNIWLAACVVSFSSHSDIGHIEARMEGETVYWVYSLKERIWREEQAIRLKEIEKDILLLTHQGLKEEEIADKINRSVQTVKFHKRHIFEKLNVHNILEAVSVAANYKLI